MKLHQLMEVDRRRILYIIKLVQRVNQLLINKILNMMSWKYTSVMLETYLITLYCLIIVPARLIFILKFPPGTILIRAGTIIKFSNFRPLKSWKNCPKLTKINFFCENFNENECLQSLSIYLEICFTKSDILDF